MPFSPSALNHEPIRTNHYTAIAQTTLPLLHCLIGTPANWLTGTFFNFQIVSFPNSQIVSLAHCLIGTLAHWHIGTLSQFLILYSAFYYIWGRVWLDNTTRELITIVKNQNMENKTLDIQSSNREKTMLLKSRIKRLIIYIGIMIIINFLMSILVKNGEARHLTGDIATAEEIRTATLSTLLVGITIFGFLIGSIVSFIPYKELKYRKKYLYFSLISIIGIHFLVFILEIRNLILF